MRNKLEISENQNSLPTTTLVHLNSNFVFITIKRGSGIQRVKQNNKFGDSLQCFGSFISFKILLKMGTADKETKPKVAEEAKTEVKEEKKDPALLTLEDVREHCR